MVVKEWYERENAAHASNQLCGSCVEEGRLLPLWSTFVLFCRRPRHKNSSTYFLVLLAILLDKTYIQLRVNYRPSLQFFPFYVFPALFSA